VSEDICFQVNIKIRKGGEKLENLKKAVYFIDSVFNVFMGKEFPQPREETEKKYPFYHYC